LFIDLENQNRKNKKFRENQICFVDKLTVGTSVTYLALTFPSGIQ